MLLLPYQKNGVRVMTILFVTLLTQIGLELSMKWKICDCGVWKEGCDDQNFQ